MKAFARLYQDSIKTEMNLEVWKKSVELYCRLRLQGNLIEDADIFIASFCIINDYVLVTNNTKHFINIEELKMDNWKN